MEIMLASPFFSASSAASCYVMEAQSMLY